MNKKTSFIVILVFILGLIAGCGKIGLIQRDKSIHLIGESGGWLYYTQEDALYKSNPEWTEKVEIIEDFPADFLELYGDTLYYMDAEGGLSSVKTDGTEKTKILKNENMFGFKVSGDWVYFGAKPGSIYRVKTDGTEKTKLADASSFKGDMYVSENLIFYVDGTSLIKMSIEGTRAVKLGDSMAVNLIKDDWVYYSEINKDGRWLNLNRMRADGTEKQRLADGAYAAIDGDLIYYVKEDGLYRSGLDGTNSEKLNDVEMWNLVGIYGDSVYYSEYSGALYRMDLDGGNKTELK